MTIRAFLLVVLLSVLPHLAFATSNASYDAAMATCQTNTPGWKQQFNSGVYDYSTVQCAVGTGAYSQDVVFVIIPYPQFAAYGGCPVSAHCYPTSFTGSPPCQNLSSVSGSIVSPSGGGLPVAASGGCCYIPMNAMGSTNAAGQQLTVGTWEPTGQTCDGTHPGLTTSPSNAPAHSSTTSSPYSETSNPDGSKTYCDTQNNKCLTVQNPSGPPASSSSSANNATNWNSKTNNPATASSTTTTTTTNSTTTASGSGPASGSSSGGAPGTWTTTGQQTSKSVTDQPASSSSTSGKCTSAVCDVGQADGQVGQMYTASGDSVQAEFASFRAQVASTPFAAAVPAFFTFNPSGVCPTWHIPGNAYWGQAGFDFTFFCNPAILAILSAAGWIVLAVGAFSAFRIALY